MLTGEKLCWMKMYFIEKILFLKGIKSSFNTARGNKPAEGELQQENQN